MDTHFGYEPSSAAASVYSCRPESEFFKTMSRRTSSVADTFQELESVGEVVTRYELDMACVCEKLANLNLLLMHMETIEDGFEAFVSDTNPNMSDLEVKALEFDFLSGFLNSEVQVLEANISDFLRDKSNMQEFISSSKLLGDASMEQEDMLRDSEKSLQHSMDQLLELKARAAMFEKNVSRFYGGETRKENDSEAAGNNELPELKDKMNLHTMEHQRHILRMLEKSLEREIEFEKRLSESTQIEEALTLRLHASEQEVILAEEETTVTLEKLYDADHSSEILMGISKDLLGKMKTLQTDLKKPASKDQETQKANMEKDNMIKDLKQRLAEAEYRAANAESKIKLLTKTSNELKSSSEKVVMLERKLRDAKTKLKNNKSRTNSFENLESMVVMMISVPYVEETVADDYYAIPRFL
ncbi:putative WPP domain-interacting tail-anchored protein [Helianthus annuus]|uniref:WPP domain-interacting tail-anchored protein n=1 Tax=Helianthus annuus TaxID=4232 RepID=A0A251UDX4_HELAN|nr:WPP domain-interacting tail-anchored protein 1-like [Helianthus annuus]KAF5799880.1 putative WPP domain-interacting tail-anchored protein [Helianthus annuus]KAJ0551273.1 putative WPP domain-interacting tail-anchored protein [Helianthus annuus]KAJ0558257.1 putative WPP domain-interacting tail-anchored protein [Helianthus annuus]KAJ0564240.1 putative WPP domain-interacting tail-anchored protein [Helianthus annuus]KAJ0729565.1 putative WPP domain-interacting tail-anchored protein [Helianthus a